jgi:pimeloyl-ACP methyl ester carboxylesterase
MPDQLIDTSASDVVPFDPASFWRVFSHDTVALDALRLHVVAGGEGAPILLLPGWPQSWYAWRSVMPELVASGRRVIAVDPRGMGDSDRPASGYDAARIVADIHALIGTLGLAAARPLDIAGHDIGTWIGHAYAAEHPETVRRLALFDAALPGLSPPPPAGIPSEEANLRTWHFAFNRLADLPEILLAGREREFLAWLFRAKSVRPWAFTEADLAEYVRVNALPGATRSALAYYRHAFSAEGLDQARARATRRLPMPVLAFGAEQGVGAALPAALRGVADDLRGGVFRNCGHYMLEEAPRAVAAQLIAFFAD